MIHRVSLFLANFSKALRLFDHIDITSQFEFPANNFEHTGEDQSHLTEDITFQKQIFRIERRRADCTAKVNSARVSGMWPHTLLNCWQDPWHIGTPSHSVFS